MLRCEITGEGCPTVERRYDVLVIGGGVNGCGIARDAAGRGFSVFLAEMDDLASGTSSRSTKLVHGGLRYLEHYEFRLVREALREREVLWRNAPHIIRPMRFVLPHHAGLRPAWMLRLGLFAYDHLGGRERLPGTRTLDLGRDPAGRPLKPGFTRAFEYSDCWVDDARLVVLNARDAADRGATVATRTRVTTARPAAGGGEVELEEQATGARLTIAAGLVVNAAGPWVDEVLGHGFGRSGHGVRLVQGSHIVVPRLTEDPRAYLFQNADGRVVFAIPYEEDFTLIGTTDLDYRGDPGAVAITEAETAYLCAAASAYFAAPVEPSEVVWSYAGVRPLIDDGSAKAQEATRDYLLRSEDGTAPLVTVLGGKITTYRRLAEAVLGAIEARLGRRGPSWTATSPLPGGDFAPEGFEAQVTDLRAAHSWLAPGHARRLARLYGTRAAAVLGGARRQADLGRSFGADLTEAELRYLIAQEWARSPEDVLWRRTKLGLRLAPAEVRAVEGFMGEAGAIMEAAG